MQREKGPEASLGHRAGPACSQGAARMEAPSWMMLQSRGHAGSPLWVHSCCPIGFLPWPPLLRWSPWAGVNPCGCIEMTGSNIPSLPHSLPSARQERAKAGQGDAVSVPACILPRMRPLDPVTRTILLGPSIGRSFLAWNPPGREKGDFGHQAERQDWTRGMGDAVGWGARADPDLPWQGVPGAVKQEEGWPVIPALIPPHGSSLWSPGNPQPCGAPVP